jgi:hypothetical protein
MNFVRRELGRRNGSVRGRTRGARLRRDAGRLHPTYAEGASDRPENPVFPGIKPVRAAKKEERAKRKLSRPVTSGNSNRAICTATQRLHPRPGREGSRDFYRKGRSEVSLMGGGAERREMLERFGRAGVLKAARRAVAPMRARIKTHAKLQSEIDRSGGFIDQKVIKSQPSLEADSRNTRRRVDY